MGSWQILGIDTYVKGEMFGRVSNAQYSWLEHILSTAKNAHFSLFMHHHALESGCPFMDKAGLEDSEKFLNFVARHKNIKTISCGHVHMAYSQTHSTAAYYATPATCFQIKPNTNPVVIDNKPPAYRKFVLSNSTADTEIVWIDSLRYDPRLPEGISFSV